MPYLELWDMSQILLDEWQIVYTLIRYLSVRTLRVYTIHNQATKALMRSDMGFRYSLMCTIDTFSFDMSPLELLNKKRSLSPYRRTAQTCPSICALWSGHQLLRVAFSQVELCQIRATNGKEHDQVTHVRMLY